MKMEHEVVAPADGTVARIDVTAGEQVDAGHVLLQMEDTSQVEGTS
jgi:biotin carboxyl carrier protein